MKVFRLQISCECASSHSQVPFFRGGFNNTCGREDRADVKFWVPGLHGPNEPWLGVILANYNVSLLKIWLQSAGESCRDDKFRPVLRNQSPQNICASATSHAKGPNANAEPSIPVSAPSCAFKLKSKNRGDHGAGKTSSYSRFPSAGWPFCVF